MIRRPLLKLNMFDSSSLDDVKYYISKSLLPYTDQRDMAEYPYFGLGEEENLDKWHHPNFVYRINKYGFRNELMPLYIQQFADIGAFGCSYTFGQGLPNDMLWHSIVAKKLNKTVLNFGNPGASIVSILDIFAIVTKHIKINTALILLPSYNRLQIAKISDYNELGILSCVPNSRGRFNSFYGFDDADILKVIPEDELVKQAKNAIYQTEFLAKTRNIKLFFSSWDLDTYTCMEEMSLTHAKLLPVWYSPQDLTDDRARDYRHPGPGHHKFFADRILPIINSNT